MESISSILSELQIIPSHCSRYDLFKKFHDLSLLYIELSALSKLSSKRYQSINQPANQPAPPSIM